MIFEKNERLREIISANTAESGESQRAYSQRLSRISGGAVSPEAFRRALQRIAIALAGRPPYARGLKEKKIPAQGKVVLEEKKDDLIWSYDGSANITNLEEALKFSKVDLNTWEVERHVFNTWTTTSVDNQKWNIQVKVWFKRRRDAGIDWSAAMEEMEQKMTVRSIPKTKGAGVGFICTADFHLGAYIDDLIRSDKFNITVLSEYLSRTAEIVNSKGYKEVHVALLGDFIESFTGLNHSNSWKGLGKGMFGTHAIVLCSQILTAFLSSINNLSGVSMVSGNHDRVTSDKEGDQKGEVGQILHHLLSLSLKIPVTYHPMVLNVVIDDISYVLTHGHLPFSNREVAKILFDYGKQGMYNVLLKGHIHSRETKKTYKRKNMAWNDEVVVHMDEVDYRAITAPPMFTGNFFSEALGYSSAAGFLEIQNNGKGRINVFDYCL